MRRFRLGKGDYPELMKRAGGRCFICGKDLAGQPIEVHHIRPMAQGGTNDLNNLALVHRSCHIKESIRGAPYSLLVRSYNLALLSIIATYLALVIVIAWVATLVPSPALVSNVGNLVITIEGILLGLTGLATLVKKIIKSLVALATVAVLWSLLTVILAQIPSQASSPLLTIVFLVDIVMFSIVVGAYSTAIIGSPIAQENRFN